MNYKKYVLFFLLVHAPYMIQGKSFAWESIFTKLYLNKAPFWGGGRETKSGAGSTLKRTKNICAQIPLLLKQFNVTSMLDAPCGDFNWMKTVNLSILDRYIGVDIVAPMIRDNTKKYGSPKRTFIKADITVDSLPAVDLILCRDLILHLPYQAMVDLFKNFKRSGAKYLLINSYAYVKTNRIYIDAERVGAYYPNLEIYPFNFPAPLAKIEEIESVKDKFLMLWKIEDLPDLPEANEVEL